MLKLDKRVLYLVYACLLAVPTFIPMGLPITIDSTTKSTYDIIDALEPGSRVAINSAFFGMTIPEQYPTSKNLIQHLFMKDDVKLIFLTFNVESPVWQEKIMSEVDKFGKEYGTDYVYLGFTPGDQTAIAAMANNLPALVQVDFYGTPLNELPDNGAIMEGLIQASDFDLLIVITTGFYDFFLGPWTSQHGVPTILGVQSVNVPVALVYWEAGQIIGLIKGATGNAEYEKLLNRPGVSLSDMDAQSLAHVFIIGLIVYGNVKYFYDKRRPTE